MPRLSLIQTNFTAGELSPRLNGRVDIARYQNGAKTIENGIPLIHGGVLRRPGTVFINTAKFSNKKSRLLPYIFNEDQAYILEFGDFYMRVFKDGFAVMSGMSIYEVVTPYSETMIWDIDYVQGADSMFIAHQSVPIHRLQRFDHNLWVLIPAPFITEPFAEIGLRPTASVTLSAATVGAGRTFTASASTFLNSDVGREITSGAGAALITGYTSSTVVTATITSAFASTSISANAWVIQGSPQAGLAPSTNGPIGEIIKLDSSKPVSLGVEKVITSITSSASKTEFTVTSVGHGYANGDVISISSVLPEYYNGTYVIYGVAADTFVFYKDVARALDKYGRVRVQDPYGYGYAFRQSYSTPKEVFRSSDVGSFIKINRGLVRITQVISASIASAEVLIELDASIPAQANAWSLEKIVWNVYDGYPSSVSLHEQRLVAAGSPSYPQTVWGSRIGEYLNFELGIADDSGMAFTISSDRIDPISHISQNRALIALTYGGEFTLTGGVEKPITPTNIQVKNQSVYGSNRVRPIRIGNELFFMQRAGRKLRSLAYRFDTDAYSAPDLSILSEHITQSGIVDMVYQQENESVLWFVRADGQLISLTIDRDQDVIAWARHTTQGFFESVAVIPNASGEEVWVVVRRTLNGNVVRHIELLSSETNTDCSLSFAADPGDDTWTGLDTLEGSLVDIVADGVVMPRQVVSGGQITLPRVAKKVEFGLPYSTRVVTLTPEVQTGTGTAQGNSMRISEVTVRFKDTTGCEVNGNPVPFRNFVPGNLDSPAPLYTGDFRVETLGWDRSSAELTIEQNQPLPFHLLAVIKKFQVND
jgi:hypothetical protein